MINSRKLSAKADQAQEMQAGERGPGDVRQRPSVLCCLAAWSCRIRAQIVGSRSVRAGQASSLAGLEIR